MSSLLFRELETHDPGCKVNIRVPSGWKVNVEFDGPSDCYRTKLEHRWGSGSMVLMLMMNPSGAGLNAMDMTVSKTARMAKRLGFSGQFIGNVCSYRATDRMRLLEVPDPVGPRNHAAILEMAAESKMIVVAHGRLPGKLQVYADQAVKVLRGAGRALHVLRLTPDGVPVHPLARGKGHIPEDTVPQVWLV